MIERVESDLEGLLTVNLDNIILLEEGCKNVLKPNCLGLLSVYIKKFHDLDLHKHGSNWGCKRFFLIRKIDGG